MSEGDRLVDALREGIDCVVRVGKPRDSDMVARRLGELEEVTCAAPAYLQRFGTPQSLDDLRHHRMVGFRSSATGALMPLAFTVAGQAQPITLPATVSVSAAESLVAAARAGLGIIQVPRYHLRGDLADGSLLPLLPDWPSPPMPVSLLYPRNRQLSPRVRVFRLVQPGIRRAQSVVTECVTARRNSAAPSCTLRPGGSGSPTRERQVRTTHQLALPRAVAEHPQPLSDRRLSVAVKADSHLRMRHLHRRYVDQIPSNSSFLPWLVT